MACWASIATCRLKEITSTAQGFHIVLLPPLEFFGGFERVLPVGLAGAFVDGEQAFHRTEEVDRADFVQGLGQGGGSMLQHRAGVQADEGGDHILPDELAGVGHDPLVLRHVVGRVGDVD